MGPSKASEMANLKELPTPPSGRASIADRIAAFDMLDRIPNATQAAKCVRLSLVGFSTEEIAAMLQTSAATVSQNLYAERKKQRPAKAATKHASKK